MTTPAAFRTLVILLAAVAASQRPAAAGVGRRIRGPAGSIAGRVSPSSALRNGDLTFLLDGARVRPQVRRNRFVLKEVPTGDHVLSAVDRAGNSGSHRQVNVRARSTTQVGTLTLTPGGRITGVVSRIDGETGGLESLPGVEVRAESEGPDRLSPQGDDVPPPPDPIILVALTDEDGVYEFRAVPPGGHRVSVVVPGLEAGAQFVWVEVGTTAVADFRLRETIEEGVGTVAGTITGAEAGGPLEGALVTIYTREEYEPPAVARGGETGTAGRGGSDGSLPRGSFSTLTDQFGHYSLNVPSGYLTMEVYAEDYLPEYLELVLHPRETLTVDLALGADVPPPTGAIEGTLMDAKTGKPVVGARVQVLVFWAQSHPFIPPDREWTAVTDKGGRYLIEGVMEGAWQVEASHKAYRPQILDVQVREGKTTRLDFQLQPGGGRK